MPFDNTETILENAEKKRAIAKKIKAIEDQMTLELEENPVADPVGLTGKVEHWMSLEAQSTKRLQRAIDYHETQLRQIREKAEISIAAAQSKLEASITAKAESDAYYAPRLAKAKKRVEMAQTKASPKIRKLQMQKETLLLEIEAMNAHEAHALKMDELEKKKETVARKLVAPLSPPDSDNDSDDTWTTEMGEARIAEIKKMEARGLYQNKATMVWEKYREEDDEEEFDRTHFAHETSPPPSPKRESLNKVIQPGYESEESYNEETHGDYKEYMKKKFGI